MRHVGSGSPTRGLNLTSELGEWSPSHWDRLGHPKRKVLIRTEVEDEAPTAEDPGTGCCSAETGRRVQEVRSSGGRGRGGSSRGHLILSFNCGGN